MKYETLLLDVDGTILDTLPDLTFAVNKTLKEFGFAGDFTIEETKKMVGKGPDYFLKQAFGPTFKEEDFPKAREAYMANYAKYQTRTVKPYEGVKELFDNLKAKGIKLIIATNKPIKMTYEVLDFIFGKDYFYDIFAFIKQELPHKPSKEFIDQIFDKHHLDKSKTLFVGDSETDILTASNSSLDSLLLTWGYGDYQNGLLDKATYIASSSQEIMDILTK